MPGFSLHMLTLNTVSTPHGLVSREPRQRRGGGHVRCAGSVIRGFMTVKGPSDSEAREPAVISGILIRNSLRSPGHMLLLVFNNGKSSCFEVGLDFGKQPREALGAQPGGRTRWKIRFWLREAGP